MSDHPDCPCLATAPTHPHAIDERVVGIDETHGRFAAVTLVRCTRCQRLWLSYHVEYEAFTASGRWGAAVIDEATAESMTPEGAAGFIDRAEWNVRGGSYFRHGSSRRGSGPIPWD